MDFSALFRPNQENCIDFDDDMNFIIRNDQSMQQLIEEEDLNVKRNLFGSAPFNPDTNLYGMVLNHMQEQRAFSFGNQQESLEFIQYPDMIGYFIYSKRRRSKSIDRFQPTKTKKQIFEKMEGFNSEVIHTFENSISMMNFGGCQNKYLQQKNMVVEDQEEHNSTPFKLGKPSSTLRKSDTFVTPPQRQSKKFEQTFGHLNDYTPLKIIGKGKIGRVFQVQGNLDGLYYAIKKVNMGEMDKQCQQLLLKELQNVANLDKYEEHQLVRFYDSHIHKDQLYIIMEHCESSLQKVLSTHQRLYESDLRKLLYEVCSTLTSVYKKTKRHHFNLRPGNILISKTKRFKIGDYGFSEISERISRGRDTKYLAPELLNNNNIDYSTYTDGGKADIFSLGIILYEIMSEKELARTSRLVGLWKLEKLNHYSQSFKALLKNMVCENPAKRFTAKDILKALKLELEQELDMTIKENKVLESKVEELKKFRNQKQYRLRRMQSI